ncbi:MAG: BspA family leucine-rich repeat surface protein [Limosilactobacillus sp.]|uniref:BspA family leucine-rich repeat surface protein n=1 Tax=Limosilactobacillus sp. TaxID=2773925 RepID=UPI002707A588|nr:BspA family leucine-rich repeat surface protein [Limosilactobacillus sp.]
MKNTQTQPTYRLVKLTIGVCSVTLMALFAGNSVVAHADDAAVTTATADVASTDNDTSAQDTSSATTTDTSADTSATDTQTAAVTDADIEGLALSTEDQATAKSYLANANDDQKAKIAQSINDLKGWTTITKTDNTYAIAGYDFNKGGYDVVLPTVGDFTNLGLTADKVTIASTEINKIARTKGVTTINTSNAGGKLTYVQVEPNRDIGFNSTSASSMDLSHLDVSGVIRMTQWFGFTPNLKTLNLSGWDTSNVVSMSQMFFGSAVTALDLSSFNTSKVTRFDTMFENAKNLTTLDLSNFDTSSVGPYGFTAMFFGMSSLKKLDVSSFTAPQRRTADTSLDFTEMFTDNNNTILLDLRKFFDSYEYTDGDSIDDMFRNMPNAVILGNPDKIMEDMNYKPSQPAYRINGETVTVKVPTVIHEPVADVHEYIKSYMDKAIADAGYKYVTEPAEFDLDMVVDVEPNLGDANLPVKWVVATDDGKVVVGDTDSTITVKDGYHYYGTKAVLDGSKVDLSGFNSGSSVNTAYAQGQKSDFTQIGTNSIGDGNGALYKYDADLVNNFNAAKAFVISHHSTDARPSISGVTIADDGTVTAVSHGITLKGQFAWIKEATDSDVTVPSEITFEYGKLPSADSIATGLPTGASATWQKEPTPEDTNGTVLVTYADGSSKTFPVHARIYSLGDALTIDHESDIYTLDPKDGVVVDPGTPLTPGDLLNPTDLPGDAKTTITGYDDKKPGDQDVTITVTFGDGSTLTTTVTVTVRGGENAADGKDTTPAVTDESAVKAEAGASVASAAVARTNQKTLPQTGNSNALAVLGMMMMMLPLGLIGIVKRREN